MPFGDKIFILLGDFRQTCPVIRGGTKNQVIDASFISSPLWKLFQIRCLLQPFRNAEDPLFAQFVDAIGDGAGPEVSLEGLDIVTEPDDNPAEDILIPRISFTYGLSSGHTLLRKQFPLAPAYTTTFNSCQGLTLDRIGVDLVRPVFSHGQLYTTLSRIRHRNHAKIRLRPQESTTIKNDRYVRRIYNNISRYVMFIVVLSCGSNRIFA